MSPARTNSLMWWEIVPFEMGNSSRNLWQGHSISPAMTSNTCMRRGSASALAMSSNCLSVNVDRPAVDFFTVPWLSNCVTAVKRTAVEGSLRIDCFNQSAGGPYLYARDERMARLGLHMPSSAGRLPHRSAGGGTSAFRSGGILVENG